MRDNFSAVEKINPCVTFAEAEAVHRRRYRAMTPVERLRLAEELSRMGREMAVRVAKATKNGKK